MKLCAWHEQVAADLIAAGTPEKDVKRAVAVLARACPDCDTGKRDGGGPTVEPTGYMGGV